MFSLIFHQFTESGGRVVNENKALTSKKNRYYLSAVYMYKYIKNKDI